MADTPTTFDEGTVNNIWSEIRELRSIVTSLQTRDTSADTASEMVTDFGDLDYRVYDSGGLLRLVLSGNDLFDELGVHANFVGLDTSAVVQFYLNANDGKAYFASGAGVIDVNGVTLQAQTYPATAMLMWNAQDTAALVGKIEVDYGGAAVNTGLRITARAHDNAVRGYIQLAAEDSSANKLAFMNLDGNGTATLDFTAVNGAVSTSLLYIKTKTTSTNAGNNALSLDTDTTGAAAAGLGSAIVFRTRNNGGGNSIQTSGYALWKWVDATVGTEDTQIDLAAMVAGTVTVVGSFTGSNFTVPGNIVGGGNFAVNPITIVAAATYTVADGDIGVKANFAGTVTVTLPSAASYPGRMLYICTVTANGVSSASGNVINLGNSTTATILGAVSGTWAILQSNGVSRWVMIAKG